MSQSDIIKAKKKLKLDNIEISRSATPREDPEELPVVPDRIKREERRNDDYFVEDSQPSPSIIPPGEEPGTESEAHEQEVIDITGDDESDDFEDGGSEEELEDLRCDPDLLSGTCIGIYNSDDDEEDASLIRLLTPRVNGENNGEEVTNIDLSKEIEPGNSVKAGKEKGMDAKDIESNKENEPVDSDKAAPYSTRQRCIDDDLAIPGPSGLGSKMSPRKEIGGGDGPCLPLRTNLVASDNVEKEKATEQDDGDNGPNEEEDEEVAKAEMKVESDVKPPRPKSRQRRSTYPFLDALQCDLVEMAQSGGDGGDAEFAKMSDNVLLARLEIVGSSRGYNRCYCGDVPVQMVDLSDEDDDDIDKWPVYKLQCPLPNQDPKEVHVFQFHAVLFIPFFISLFSLVIYFGFFMNFKINCLFMLAHYDLSYT